MMNLRLLVSVLACAALVATAAAQSGDYSQGDTTNPPSQTQTITVTIPERLALHLTETTYDLDLDSLTAYDPSMISGAYNWPTAEGCMMLPKGMEDDVAELAAVTEPETGEFAALTKVIFDSGLPTASYPAVVLDGSGNVATDVNGNYLKGTLVCFNQKIVQKFSNVPWSLSADIAITGDVGKFGIADDADGGAAVAIDGRLEAGQRFVVTQSASDLELAFANHPTGGWLDDRITEFFWFDGTEAPGNHTIVVTYTLAGQP